MATVRDPTTFADHFGISQERLQALGVFNPTLALDTRLFIDPLLLPFSKHTEIREGAAGEYVRHFETIIKFLSESKVEGDVAWRSARKLLEFHEVQGTCLGYGAGTIHGSGFGGTLTDRVMRVGKEIVNLGIRHPDLFIAMALFEDDIGPDRICDMTANVVEHSLATFNKRILGELGLSGDIFDIDGTPAEFLPNPLQTRRTPIILLPADILRKLPVANSWDEIADAASQSEAIKRRVNRTIAHIWEVAARRSKAKLRGEALASKEAFETLLELLHGVRGGAYDLTRDPDGFIVWARKAKEFTSKYPLDLKAIPRPTSTADAEAIVQKIIGQFRHLIENAGLNHELYKDGGRPRHESTAQRLFFAVAYSYCKANDLDISPEIDTGTGKIDFKFSKGFACRVLVEIKLSTNPKVVLGYTVQLEVYKEAQETLSAIYLIIDVGGLGEKPKQLNNIRNEARAKGQPLSVLEFVDGKIYPSASKR